MNANIKFEKIKSYDLVKLLKQAGVVHGNNANPSAVYVSDNDYKKIKAMVTKQAKKEYPNLKSMGLKGLVGMHLLNLGPNQSLGKYLKDGYMLIIKE